jgi:hypothetical protein
MHTSLLDVQDSQGEFPLLTHARALHQCLGTESAGANAKQPHFLLKGDAPQAFLGCFANGGGIRRGDWECDITGYSAKIFIPQFDANGTGGIALALEILGNTRA